MKLRSLRCLILGTTLFCCIAQAMQQPTSSNSQNSDNKGLPEVPYFIASNMIGPKREFIKENKDRVIIQQVRVLQQGLDATCGYHAFKNACLLAGIIQGRTDGRLLMDPGMCEFFGRDPLGKARAEIIRLRKINAFKERLWQEQLKVLDPQIKGSQLQTAYKAALSTLIDKRIDEYNRNKIDNPITGEHVRQALAATNDQSQAPEFNENARKPEVYERYVHIKEEPIAIAEYINEDLSANKDKGRDHDLSQGEWLHSNEIEMMIQNPECFGTANLINARGNAQIIIIDKPELDAASIMNKNQQAIYPFCIYSAAGAHWIAMVAENGQGWRRYTIANSLSGVGNAATLQVIETLEGLPIGALADGIAPADKEDAKEEQKENSTSLTNISADQLIESSFNEITISKSLWLSPDQSKTLFWLVRKIEKIMGKVEKLLSGNTPADEAAIHDLIQELLKTKKILARKNVNFVRDLIANDVHHANHEIKEMLDNLVITLQQLHRIYNKQDIYQQPEKSSGIIDDLKELINPFQKLKGRLLIEIGRSSLIIENPFDQIRQQEQDRLQSKPKTNGTSDERTEKSEDHSLTAEDHESEQASSDKSARSTGSTKNQKKAHSHSKRSASMPKTLHDAALLNDCRGIESLIKEHNINQLNDVGLAPLHIAIRSQNLNATITLLENGADPNVYDRPGALTPLHYAVLTNYANIVDQMKVINELLDRHADINAQGCKEQFWLSRIFLHLTEGTCTKWATPLHIAAQKGNYRVAKLLVDRGADVKRLNQAPLGATDYVTPLSYAVNGQHSNIVDLLLENGAMDPDGDGVLISAANSCNITILKSLLSRDYFCKSAARALHYMWLFPNLSRPKKRLEAAKLLLDKIMEKQITNEARYEFSIMPNAIMFNCKWHIEMVELLAKYQLFNLNELLFLIISEQPDMFASYSKDVKERCIRFLLAKGADIRKLTRETSRNYYCLRHLLHEAAEAGDTSRVKALLAMNRNLRNQKDENDNMPIHLAASIGHWETVNALCQGMAIIDHENNFGLLPLHCAALAGHTNIAAALLSFEKSKSIDAKNIHGLTPLHAAIMAGKDDVARLLLDQGANTDVKDQRGWTPIDYARQNQIMQMQFDPDFAIPQLVKQHSENSPQEDHGFTLKPDQSATPHKKDKNAVEEIADRKIEFIDIAETFKDLQIHGQILPSLLQERGNGQITMYCGYYSLYNALSLLNPETHSRLDRQGFSKFFGSALTEIWKVRKYGPGDNLAADEIRHLVNTLYPNDPIIAIDKNSLYAMISGQLSLEEAFNNDQKSINSWRQFMKSDDAKLAIIAEIGINAGHWITIFVKREKDAISLQVTDSLCEIQSWLYNGQFFSLVLPFYLALTIPEQEWQAFFDDSFKNRLFAEYRQQTDQNETHNANILSITLNQLIASIDDMSESLQWAASALMKEKQSTGDKQDYRQILLAYMRLHHLKSTMEESLKVLVLSKSVKNPATQPLEDLINLLFEKSQSLVGQIQKLNNLPKNLDSTYKTFNRIITLLREMRQPAQSIIDRLDEDESLLTDENFFDADLMPLEADQLKSVIDCAPQTIKNIIGHLKNPAVKQQIIRILFVGPPGNGKTTLAQAIAQECNRPYRFIRASALGDCFQFSRERDLKRLMPFIQKHPDAIIIIDEIDAIKDRENEPNRTAEVLQAIIDTCNRRFPKVIFIATTNDQKAIPKPLFSRLSQIITEIKEPDYKLRFHMINRCVNKLNESKISNNLTTKYLEKLAGKTDYFSIRHIEAMFRTAIINASSLQDNPVEKPSLKAWLLRKKLSRKRLPNTITEEIMEQAYSTTCESLKAEKTSRIRKAARYLWENKDKIGHLCQAGAGLGMQGYQIYAHSKERKEDLALHNTERNEDKWWNRAPTIIAGLQLALNIYQVFHKGSTTTTK